MLDPDPYLTNVFLNPGKYNVRYSCIVEPVIKLHYFFTPRAQDSKSQNLKRGPGLAIKPIL
jgi:hypothetical protein